MKPYGRRAPLRYNYQDHHLVGYGNWWEDETTDVNKKKARREAKNRIQIDIEEQRKESYV